jgi:uncharacterized protein (DUF2132 family)
MTAPQSNDPLHGLTLKTIVTELSEELGWDELSWRIPIRCFQLDPSIKSSLTFLRKTPWARTKVEHLYLEHQVTKPNQLNQEES